MKIFSKKITVFASSILLASLAGSTAFADDSQRLVRSVSSSQGGEAQNPEPEGEHAFIKLMNFHVPSQAASGELVPVEYYNIDDVLVKTEEKAKPLVNVYVYGPVIGFEELGASGFAGHGRRDAFGAISLDDGETWKVTNLSKSADESSFEVSTPLQDPGCADDPDVDPPVVCEDITEYPGDVPNVFHAVAGNKVMVAWHSKYCSSGNPAWSAEFPRDDVADYLGINNDADIYLTDLFGAAGSQSSTDYVDNPPVGEVPYSCLWSARGVLREDPEAAGTTQVVWFQAERLTGGARDVNRVETSCVAGGGCAITWQEDPEGVRPGEGEGPGTGWSGATTASQTDVWYSFIEWEDFDIVDDDGTALPLADNIVGGRPQVYVPMMVAARLTNNARCQTDAEDQYCNSDVDLAYGIKDQCVGTVDIPAGQQGNLRATCVVDANGSGAMDAGDLPNVANTAASRPRLNLQPRDTDGDDIADDAWVIIVHEEDKGLGNFGFLNDEEWDGNVDSIATDCEDSDTSVDDNCVKADTGKNQWYISFALGTPQTSVLDETAAADLDYSMLYNLVAQQNQYNAPEVNWHTGTFYPPMSTEQMWNFGDLNFSIFNTEISRRASLMTQSLAKAETGSSGIVAMPLFKEGIINQGGPADIMARRIVYNQCPIDFEDPEGPVISKVDRVQYNADGKNIKIKGTVTELDELKKTGFFIRDAVNTDYVFFEENTAPKDWENFLATNMEYPPCYIQASDEAPAADGTSVGNWGEAFDLTDLWEEIGVECECIIPQTPTPLSKNQSAPDTAESFSLLSLPGVSDAVAAMKQSASDAAESFSWLSLLGISDAVAAKKQPASAAKKKQPASDAAESVSFAAQPTVTLAAAGRSENPYDFSNMECAWYDGEGGVTEGVWLFDPETDFNPYYPKGLCTAPAINLSGRTPQTCEATGDSDGICPGDADMTCTDDDEFGQLCLSETDPEDNQLLDKLISWYECPGWNGTDVSNSGGADTVPGTCYTEPDSVLLDANLDDRSWYNPIDVSKAHRGFLDGDHVFMIYAWSPNWKLNAIGRDRYELYTRRSFDGGVSWTTTPGSFAASNGESYSGSGTTTCETWRDGDGSLTDSHVCTQYEAGVPEQSRNVSQHKSMKITTLDPRYTPTVAEMADMAPEGIVWGLFEPIDPTDIRDPSRNFVVFESGDNTTVAVGEAEPLNLDYGRAVMFGDNFQVWAEEDDLSVCYPNDAHGTTDVDWAVGTGFCNEFDTMEGFPLALSEEASVTASAYGDFLYGVWGQFNVEENEETGENEFVDGDSMFRRIWYLDDYISDDAWTLPGTQ